MEARLISCLICPATFDLVDALRTHLLREHGNGVSGETKESGSRSEDASIKDAPALRVSLEHEASFEKSTLVHDEILGLPAQTKEISQQQNECPLESNDRGQFVKQCFKEQTSDLSYVEVKHEVVQDYENRAATGPEEGASSTSVKYLDSSSSLNQGGDNNGAKDLKESIHKTNGSSTDVRGVFKDEYQDGSFILDDSDRRRKKKKEVTCVQVNIQVYRLPLCEECGISFGRKEVLQDHINIHNRGMKTISETCIDPEEMESVGQTDLPMRGKNEINLSDTDSCSLSLPECTEEIKESLERKTLTSGPKMKRGSERRFGCSVCSKRFLQKGHLEEHMISHTRDYPFKCDVCERKFKRNSELQQHNCHEDPRFRCSVCSKNYIRKWRLLEHMTKIHKISQLRRFGCNECGKHFLQKGHLKEHMISHTRDYPFKCDVCDRKFRRNSRLKQHDCPSKNLAPNMILKRRSLKKVEKMDKRSQTSQKTREVDGIVETPENETHLDDTDSCSIYLPECTEEISGSLEKKTLTSSPKMKRGSERRYGCSVCSKRFLQKGHLKKHMISHTRDYPFKCDVCERKFKRNSELQQHNCHEDLRFRCSVCSKSYIQKWRLKEHLTKIHNAKVKCKRNSDLKQHDCPSKNQATNILKRRSLKRVKEMDKRSQKTKELDGIVEKPESETNLSDTNPCRISLPDCTEEIKESLEKKTFTSLPTMKKGSERKYGCNECGKRFLQKGHLKEHMIIHTKDYPFKCDVCEWKFRRNSELKQHDCPSKNQATNISKRKRRFRCKECSMSYMQKWSLQQHMITHKKVFQFGCDVCERTFSSNSEMKQHNCPCKNQATNILKRRSWKKVKKMDKRSQKTKELDGIVEKPENETDLSDTNSCNISLPECTEEKNESLEKKTYRSGPKTKKGSERRYACSVCGKRFLQKGHLKEHMIIHTKDYPFKCDVCERKFKRNSELKQHNCLGKRRFRCKECSMSYMQKWSLQQHMITHKKVFQFGCDVCKRKFSRNSEMKQHNCLGPPRCVHKEKQIVRTKNSEKRKEGIVGLVKTPKNEFQLSEANSYSRIERVSENEKIFGVTNEPKDLEKGNMKLLTEVDLPVKSDIGNTNLRRKSEFITCNICNKDVPNQRRLLRIHRYTHKKHACEVCKKLFVSPSDLKTHMMVHTGERPVLCSQCGKGFRSQGMLNIHLKSHSNVKPFKCSTCGKSFKAKSALKQHCIQNHTGERTTLCHICGKAFFHLIGLRAHMLTHEATMNYECSICGKAFRNLSQLNQHKLAHSEEKKIKCEFCDYRCYKNSNLKSHMRKHSDERPYKCDECEQTFKRKDYKDIHMRIHSGYRPYQCDACDAAFTHYAGLYLHKKRHAHEITK